MVGTVNPAVPQSGQVNREWLKAWRVLLGLAAVNLIVLGAYVGHGLFIAGARGIPAAGLVMVGVGAVATFVVALIAAALLRAAVAKNIVSIGLVILGIITLSLDPVRPELTASGIVGTTFAVIVIVGGGLGLYEAYSP